MPLSTSPGQAKGKDPQVKSSEARKTNTISRAELIEYKERNIKIAYFQTLLYSLYQSICMWNVFDAYINILAKNQGSSHANTWVGAVESVNGLATLIFAIPCGIMADKYDRTTIARFASVLGCFAACLSAYGFKFDCWPVLFSAMWVWGLFAALVGTSAEAIFADSCESGSRSERTAMKGTLQSAGLGLGPLLMWFIFEVYGNTWDLSVIHVPLLAGCFLAPLCALPLWYLKDLRSFSTQDELESGLLNLEDNARRSTNAATLQQRGFIVQAQDGERTRDTKRSRHIVSSMSRPRGDSVATAQAKFLNKTDGDLDNLLNSTDIHAQIHAEEERFKRMNKYERGVPYFLTIADFIMEMGAGMTVRFFTLFFMNDFGVTPKQMSLIFGVYPLFVALATLYCQKLSHVVGRAQISFVGQTLGIVCLLSMCIVDNLTLLIIIFFLRSAFQNGPYPVDRSILYDYIPSSRRGKWASISSMLTMTWSGSAVLGGYLTDQYDYRFTFLVTSCVYALGLLFYFPLLFLVPRREMSMI